MAGAVTAYDHPTGLFSTTTLTSTPQTIGTASVQVIIPNGLTLVGGAATKTVLFKNTATTALFSVVVPANVAVPIPPFKVPAGLTVETSAAAGDLSVVAPYVVI
jgi:hypothetical protein